MKNKTVAEDLSENLERLTGCKIGAAHIQTDKSIFFGHIPKGSLLRGHPLILCHFAGMIFVILPYKDWENLNHGKTPVWKYINDSIWSYGYYLAGPSVKDHLYWQELEGGQRGIHDTAKVQRYLTMMQCRVHYKHLGKMPDEARCAECSQKGCPMSKFPPKRRGGSWENEVKERHVRVEFYDAIAKKMLNRFGLKVAALHASEEYDESEEKIYLFPGFVPVTVRVVVPEKLLVDMLYHPQKYDIPDMLKRYKLVAAYSEYDPKTRQNQPTQYMKIASNTTTDDLNKFWGRA